MVDALSYAVIATALLFAIVVLVYVALDRIPDWTLLGLAGVVEALTVVLVIASAVLLATGSHEMSGIDATTYFGYLATALFALPVGFFWSLAEKSRGATAVLAAASLTHAFLVVRTFQIWGAA
jgi:hypothetical protein